MTSKRALFHGIIVIESSLCKTNIYFLGIRILKILYFAQKKEYRLFGIFRILTRDDYPFTLSVLMPAHNSEKHIAGAIDSILAQTFSDFEFIIINNGSVDNTAGIVRGYKDSRIVFVDNARTLGPAEVLSMGIGLCRGKYIARMDADARLHPDRLEGITRGWRCLGGVGGKLFYAGRECEPGACEARKRGESYL